MTEEELQAFKKLQEIKWDFHSEYWEFGRKTDKEMEKWANTLIQLIKKQQKEIEKLNKYVLDDLKDCISKDKIREHLKKLNISDIEPWTVYKISGIWLFNLERLLEKEYNVEELLK